MPFVVSEAEVPADAVPSTRRASEVARCSKGCSTSKLGAEIWASWCERMWLLEQTRACRCRVLWCCLYWINVMVVLCASVGGRRLRSAWVAGGAVVHVCGLHCRTALRQLRTSYAVHQMRYHCRWSAKFSACMSATTNCQVWWPNVVEWPPIRGHLKVYNQRSP